MSEKISWKTIKKLLLTGALVGSLATLTSCGSNSLSWVDPNLKKELNSNEVKILKEAGKPVGLDIKWYHKPIKEVENEIYKKYGDPIRYNGLTYEETSTLSYGAGEAGLGKAQAENKAVVMGIDLLYEYSHHTVIGYTAMIVTPEKDWYTISDSTGDGKINGFCEGLIPSWNLCTGHNKQE